MKYCKDCLCFKDCQRLGQTADFPVDDGVCLNFVQMTNADRIRAMSDEELAEFMTEKCGGKQSALRDFMGRGYSLEEGFVKALYAKLRMQWLDWLRQPVKDGEDE